MKNTSLGVFAVFLCISSGKTMEEIKQNDIEQSIHSEHSIKTFSSITMNDSLGLNYDSKKSSITLGHNLTNYSYEESVNEQNKKKSASIATFLLGNNEGRFFTPFLKHYTIFSLHFWSIARLILEESEMVMHATSISLSATAGLKADNQIRDTISLAIQAGLLANGFHRIYHFATKVLPHRTKQISIYKSIEKQQKDDQNFLYMPQSISSDSSNNPEIYSSHILKNFYAFYAVYRNVAWDILGFSVILCRTISYSLLAWSSTMPIEDCKRLSLAAACIGIVGSICEIYVKILAKKTPEIEKLAMRTSDAEQSKGHDQC